jgi:hypothetical protein
MSVLASHEVREHRIQAEWRSSSVKRALSLSPQLRLRALSTQAKQAHGRVRPRGDWAQVPLRSRGNASPFSIISLLVLRVCSRKAETSRQVVVELVAPSRRKRGFECPVERANEIRS